MAKTPGIAPETPDTDPTARGRNTRTLWGRGLVGAAIVFIAAMWIFAVYQARQPPPERMDDAAVSQQAEAICAPVMAQVAALPQAFTMTSATERAAVIDQSDVLLTGMVDKLAALPPVTERDTTMYSEWIDDWTTYLGDRARYGERLREDPNARFNVTDKSKDQITDPVDRFAKANRMPSCLTPQDLG